jgi:hypothetical protein
MYVSCPGSASKHKYGVIKYLDTAINQAARTGTGVYPIATNTGTTIFQAEHYFSSCSAWSTSLCIHRSNRTWLASRAASARSGWRNSQKYCNGATDSSREHIAGSGDWLTCASHGSDRIFCCV